MLGGPGASEELLVPGVDEQVGDGRVDDHDRLTGLGSRHMA